MASIRMIPEEEATRTAKEIYEDIKQTLCIGLSKSFSEVDRWFRGGPLDLVITLSEELVEV
jgi:hypothetical protein